MLEALIPLLPQIMKVAPNMKGQSRVDIFTFILVMFELMSPKQYETFLQSLKKQNEDWVNLLFFTHQTFHSLQMIRILS